MYAVGERLAVQTKTLLEVCAEQKIGMYPLVAAILSATATTKAGSWTTFDVAVVVADAVVEVEVGQSINEPIPQMIPGAVDMTTEGTAPTTLVTPPRMVVWPSIILVTPPITVVTRPATFVGIGDGKTPMLVMTGRGSTEVGRIAEGTAPTTLVTPPRTVVSPFMTVVTPPMMVVTRLGAAVRMDDGKTPAMLVTTGSTDVGSTPVTAPGTVGAPPPPKIGLKTLVNPPMIDPIPPSWRLSSSRKLGASVDSGRERLRIGGFTLACGWRYKLIPFAERRPVESIEKRSPRSVKPDEAKPMTISP